MSGGHTPGPWRADVEKRPAPGSGYWYVVLDSEENALGEFYGDDHETNTANLQMAALAPELIEACEAVVKLVEGFPGYGTCTNPQGRLKDQQEWVKFYNLTAKARGQA